MSRQAMAPAIVCRKCTTLDEFRACVALQQQIWGETDLEIEPATMFVVAANSGGQVLGAFDGGNLIGYILAIVGLHHGTHFLHSHHAGVHPDYRDQGVGRRLKLYQREEALGRGIRLIEWTFDPLETRNAHFNLNRLGAIARQYRPDLYGVTTSPLHRRLATDRLVAEWHLDSRRVVAAIHDLVKESAADAPASIELPDDLEQWKHKDMEQVRRVQQRIREEFTSWFGRGYAAVGMRKTKSGRAYLLAPWSDF